MNGLQFRLWALLQSNLSLSDKIDHACDPEHKARLQQHYDSIEEEIKTIRNTLQEANT